MRRLAAAALLLVAAPAAAQDEPRFCPNRPDLGTSTCTTDVGRVLGEVSVADWQRDGDERSLLIGDLLLRTGLGPRTEAQLSWTPLSRLVAREDGARDAITGVGDVRLGLRQNLLRPDGGGFSLALEGFATLPTATRGLGRGDWSAGVVLPVSLELGDWSLGFTAEVDAETNESRIGRHVAEAANLGLGRDLTDTLSATVEIAVRRDEDPSDTDEQWLAAVSAAWEVRPHAQLDVLVAAGLNSQAPELRVALGGAMLF